MSRQVISTVEEARAYALSKYEQGGDIIVECWSDAQVEEFIKGCGRRSVRKALDKLFADTRTDEWSAQFDEIIPQTEDTAEHVEDVQTDNNEEMDMDEYLATFVRANRCSVQAIEEGYLVKFYRTHKHVGSITVKTEDGAHNNALREQARKFAISQCPSYEIMWDPTKAEQAWDRKYNTYLTDDAVAEDTITLVTPAIERLVNKSRYNMVLVDIMVTAITPKESKFSYVQDGKYVKSGAWCVADIELTISTDIGGNAVDILYNVEMKSGQICKVKTTIADWNEIVARELELQGITINESKTA